MTVQIKNTSGEARDVPSLGIVVEAGRVVDVDDDAVYGFTQQEGVWAPYGEPAEELHQQGADAYALLVDAELHGQHPQEPAGNASRDEWAAYVLAARLANPDEIEDLGRDALRDTYGTPQED